MLTRQDLGKHQLVLLVGTVLVVLHVVRDGLTHIGVNRHHLSIHVRTISSQLADFVLVARSDVLRDLSLGVAVAQVRAEISNDNGLLRNSLLGEEITDHL